MKYAVIHMQRGVREREREGERDGGKESERQRQKERERERLSKERDWQEERLN